MANIGGEVYTHESFEQLYNDSIVIQNIVDDYDESGIVIGDSETFDNDSEDESDEEESDEEKKHVGDNNRKRISQAAKRAAKKATKKKI